MTRQIEARATVRCDLDAVCTLVQDPSNLFPHPGLRPGTYLTEVVADLHDGTQVRQHVVLEIGIPTVADGAVTAVAWYPVAHNRVLPAFEGTLEITSVPDGDTELRVSGSYRPPLGPLGVAVDAIGMHRLARRTLLDFVQNLASAFEAAVSVRRGAAWAMSPTRADDLRPSAQMPPDHWLG